MNYEVIDNFLSKNDFEKIKNLMMGPSIPWYFCDFITDSRYKHEEGYYYEHIFYIHDRPTSELINDLYPLISKIAPNALMRIKGNMYPKFDRKFDNYNHVDYDFSHKGAIFYINNNNGPTVLEDKIEILPKENRILFFDASKPHRSVHCSDQKVRVNINFNYF
jgi:hypothetical protein